MVGIQVSQGAALNLGKQSETITTADGSVAGDGNWDIIGVEVKDQGSSLLGGQQTTIRAIQETDDNHEVIGLEAQSGTTVTLGGNALIAATINSKTNNPSHGLLSYGLVNNGSAVTLGTHAEVESTGYIATGILTQNEESITNLGDLTQIKVSSMTGVDEKNNAAYVTGIFTKDGGLTVLGRNVVIAAEAQAEAEGINTGSQGKTVAGDGLSVTADNKGDGFTYAIFTSDDGTAEIGDDASLIATNRNGGSIAGIATESGGTTTVGNRAAITASNTGGGAIGISSVGGTTLTGTDTSITVNSLEGMGIYTDNGTTSLESGAITVNGDGGMGIVSYNNGYTVVGDHTSITVTGEKLEDDDLVLASKGLYSFTNGITSLGNNASITVNGTEGTGIVSGEGGQTIVGENASVTVKGENGVGVSSLSQGVSSLQDNASITVNGIAGTGVISQESGSTVIGENASVTVKGEKGVGVSSLSQGASSFQDNASITVNGTAGTGIVSQESGSTVIGENASITVNGANGVGISSLSQGASSFQDNASITVNGTAGTGIVSEECGQTIGGKNASVIVNGEDGVGISSLSHGITSLWDNAFVSAESRGVESKTAGAVIFAGSANIMGGQYSLFSQDADSLIDLTAVGARKNIQGNMLASDGGTIRAVLDTGDSFFTGSSAVEGESSELDLDLSHGAQWNMTGDSSVTNLTLNSGAVVNMAANSAYQQLSANNFSGSNGIFYMKTDLDSQTDGDKVYLTRADAGSSGKIQVYDASLVRGKEVTGMRHLLLVTDDSGQASFTGESLNQGGLWDVTPTIQNGSYVRNTLGVADAKDTEWYLTKLEKTVNEDSRPLLVGGDNVYGMYRHSLDTLRQRRGNLRQRNKQDDADGIWVRDRGGRMTGDGWDSKYNIFQLGYEYSVNPGSVYGLFGERGIASPDYKTGTGKEHTFAGGLYGTWFGSHGSYTDVVAKFGRDDSHISTFGPYPDSADYRTDEQSLSIEYGKTIYRGKKREFFIEPQAKLVFGHFNDVSYTTARKTRVERDAFNSTIGRLGIVLGKTHDQGRHPFDYYLKASVLHEFGDSQDVHMQSANGETLDTNLDYGETWYEAGFGGTYRLSSAASLYADVERSFSSNITTKWQVNAGLTWQF
ncbi:autotransporter outer membrane beta-barrel domain-containing protein [uncultured Megasphaera sp.]|uniref:autotransporter outer membrane beta-barrel domain-containing protein n=1 Tax=uncultured Megasphaera sp. TaxID=165188 RepID=UPI00263841F1|nr:autotransporter outer membrane beta-barrel domain-containing protein [uncultured Megasphaera sp.]